MSLKNSQSNTRIFLRSVYKGKGRERGGGKGEGGKGKGRRERGGGKGEEEGKGRGKGEERKGKGERGGGKENEEHRKDMSILPTPTSVNCISCQYVESITSDGRSSCSGCGHNGCGHSS